MKKFITLIFLLLPLANFAAWVEIGRNNEERINVFIDVDGIVIGKTTKLVKTLYDFERPNQQFNKAHLSEVEVLEVNCSQKQFRLPQVTWYSKNKGHGSVVWRTQNSEWQVAEFGTGYAEILNRACH